MLNTIAQFKNLPLTISTAPMHNAIANSTLVLAASGSATLEVILLKKPLIVFAALPKITYFFAKFILKINLPYISLPNFLANKPIIPEFVQNNIIVDNVFIIAKSIIKKPKNFISNHIKIIECLKNKKMIYNQIVSEIFSL